MPETGFRLTVNGAERSVSCEPDTPLLDVLRHDLGLAGPRVAAGWGCAGRASCSSGAVPGRPVTCRCRPWTARSSRGRGWRPAAGGRLHPVQQAFIDEQAAQCGYCTSGMVMAAAGLLRDRLAPTEQEVRDALDSKSVPLRDAWQDRLRGAEGSRAGSRRAGHGPAPARRATPRQPASRRGSGRGVPRPERARCSRRRPVHLARFPPGLPCRPASPRSRPTWRPTRCWPGGRISAGTGR